MKIVCRRTDYGTTYTIGRLSIDGTNICYTLEDKVREVSGKPVSSWKIAGSTAIPSGTYKLIVDYSNRFQKDLPHILDVPGFEGVRIHTGNSSANTEGCILLGMNWAGGDWVSLSKDAMTIFMTKLNYALSHKEEVTIEIQNT